VTYFYNLVEEFTHTQAIGRDVVLEDWPRPRGHLEDKILWPWPRPRRPLASALGLGLSLDDARPWL